MVPTYFFQVGLNKVLLLVHDLPRLYFFFWFSILGLYFSSQIGGEGAGEGSLLSPLIPLSKISQAMEGQMIDGGSHNRVSVCFFGGKISPNFDLKNMVSTYTKDFNKFKKLHGKKMAEIRQISTQKKFQISPEFYDKFQ